MNSNNQQNNGGGAKQVYNFNFGNQQQPQQQQQQQQPLPQQQNYNQQPQQQNYQFQQQPYYHKYNTNQQPSSHKRPGTYNEYGTNPQGGNDNMYQKQNQQVNYMQAQQIPQKQPNQQQYQPQMQQPKQQPQPLPVDFSNVKQIGNYFIFLNKPLGSGTFGTVYLCQDRTTQQQYACKMVRVGTMDIDQELNVSKQIKGQYICEIVFAAKTDNYLYLVAELCTDGTLKKYVQDDIKFDLMKSMIVFSQIVRGYYESLFKHNCIHRDLKFDNILMKNEKPKICDFGFGKFLSDVTVTIEQSQRCTPVFGSPQITNEELIQYNYKADIYSLGVILYMMVNQMRHPNDVRDHKGLFQYLADSKNNGIRKALRFYNDVHPLVKELIYDLMEYKEEQRIGIEPLLDRCEQICNALRKPATYQPSTGNGNGLYYQFQHNQTTQ